MRRFSDPCGGVAEQDVLAAADLDVDMDKKDPSYEAWATYRKADKAGMALPRSLRSKSGGANKVKGDGHVLNGLNRRTGEPNRCYNW